MKTLFESCLNDAEGVVVQLCGLLHLVRLDNRLGDRRAFENIRVTCDITGINYICRHRGHDRDSFYSFNVCDVHTLVTRKGTASCTYDGDIQFRHDDIEPLLNYFRDMKSPSNMFMYRDAAVERADILRNIILPDLSDLTYAEEKVLSAQKRATIVTT